MLFVDAVVVMPLYKLQGACCVSSAPCALVPGSEYDAILNVI